MAEQPFAPEMARPAFRFSWAGGLPAVAYLAVAVAALWVRPPLPIDETRYLAVAWATYLHENHILLALNDAAYTHKTPLLFALIEELWDLTGPSEKAARLVPILFGAAAILLMRALVGILSRGRAPAVGRAHWVLVGLPVFAVFAQLLLFDAMLTCGALMAVIGAVLAARGRLRAGFVLVLAGVAFGFASKGPVILLHTAPVAFLAPLWAGVRLPLSKGRWTALMAGSILTGALINAIWVVPEFIGLSKAYGWELLWTQTFGRVEGQIGHPRPVWFFLVLMPAVLFPWIASRAFWSKRAWKKALEAESVRLGLVWFGGAVLLHSLSSGKQLHYLLPSLPGAALVLAGLLEAGPDKDRAQRAPIAAGAALILLVASALLAAAALPATAARLAGIDIAIATLSALGLVICGLACWGMARVPDRWRMPGAAVAGLGAILLIQASLPSVWERNDAARIAAAVPELRDAPAAWIGTYQGEFTFAARRTMPVENLEQLDAALEWLKLHPTGVVLWRTTQREIHMAGIRDSLLPWRGRSLAVLRLAAH